MAAVLSTGCGASVTDFHTAIKAVATGSVSCGTVTGRLAFEPPLTATGTGPERATVTLRASDCTTTGSSASTVGSGSADVTLTSPTSTCSGVLTLRSVALTIHWTPATIRPSTVSFSGYSITSTPSGSGGFAFPDPGGRSSVTGSFAGMNRGAGSTAAIYFQPSAAQLQAVCRSSGLAALPVTSGTIALT